MIEEKVRGLEDGYNRMEQLIKSLFLEIHNNVNFSIKHISLLEDEIEYLKSRMKIDSLREKNGLTDKMVDILIQISSQFYQCQICGKDKILIQCPECKRHTCKACLDVITLALGEKQCLYCGQMLRIMTHKRSNLSYLKGGIAIEKGVTINGTKHDDL
ncbi:MAG: hypothetical protein ACFFFH_02545 [Candidatus Thorarchaeota archaeon]